MNKLFDSLVIVFLILLMILAASCTTPTEDDFFGEPLLELDGRLPMDSNGYYHLVLNPNTNQTIHTIAGVVSNIYEPTKIDWDSNLYWEYNGEFVPTINSSSYVQKDGTINTVIAPILGMKNDTLVVYAKVNEWNIIRSISIVLE